MGVRDMLHVLRAAGWRQTLADIIGLVALVVALYAFTVVASGLVPE